MRCRINGLSLRLSDITGSVIALAIITKGHTDQFKQEILISAEAVRYKSKVPTDLAPGESPLSCLADGHLLTVYSRGREHSVLYL